jgi:hypothetical protein
MMNRMLGRRPPKRAPSLRLESILRAVPKHPASADHLGKVTEWILGGNDKYGDCGPVMVANSRLLTTTYLTPSAIHNPSEAAILDLYRRCGNPDFDPNDPGGPGDGGVDVQTMLEEVHANGIDGVRSVAFASMDPGNRAVLDAAVDAFGFAGPGVTLDVAQQSQTDAGLWKHVSRSPVWGGHAALIGRYHGHPDRTGFVTWAMVVDATDGFLTYQVEELWAIIWPEHLRSARFDALIDLAAFEREYQALTGKPLVLP